MKPRETTRPAHVYSPHSAVFPALPTPAGHLRIVVVDDHDLIRLALKAIIAAAPVFYQWDGEAASFSEGQQLLLAKKPDIAIIDISLADGSGLDLIEQLRRPLPDTRFVVLSAHVGAVQVARALKAGAAGYVLKNHVMSELHPALQAVTAGKSYLSPGLERLPASPELTPRQTDVLRGVARGMSAKVLARQLGISNKTVEFHKAELKKRLGVTDNASLTLYALQLGLLD